MKPNAKAFLFLLAISAMALTLAFIIRERNLTVFEETRPPMVTPVETPLAVSQPPKTEEAVAPQVPSLPVSASSTYTFFRSSDGQIQAALEGYPFLKNPFTFFGTGIAFENRLMWRVRDAKRTLLGEGGFDVASPDVGVPGPFRVTVSYRIPPQMQKGTLFIFEASAKDGSPIHVVQIPVTFVTSTTL